MYHFVVCHVKMSHSIINLSLINEAGDTGSCHVLAAQQSPNLLFYAGSGYWVSYLLQTPTSVGQLQSK